MIMKAILQGQLAPGAIGHLKLLVEGGFITNNVLCAVSKHYAVREDLFAECLREGLFSTAIRQSRFKLALPRCSRFFGKQTLKHHGPLRA